MEKLNLVAFAESVLGFRRATQMETCLSEASLPTTNRKARGRVGLVVGLVSVSWLRWN